MSFELGQTFNGNYPAEAAIWCNERENCYIAEIAPAPDGVRRFQIVATPDPSVDEVRRKKLLELEESFLQWYEKDAVVTSKLGFVADSDSRAMMDVIGLVTSFEAAPEETRSPVAFMDHNNISHMLTLEQLKVVQLEIISNGRSAYAQKWALRTQIESAESVEALQAIEITFTGLDFSAAS